MDKNTLIHNAKSVFHDNDNPISGAYFAPSRVNLIGEHIDYNGGYVLPFSISFGTWLVVIPNNLGIHRMFSENVPDKGVCSLPVDCFIPAVPNEWYNYPFGVIKEFYNKHFVLSPSDFYFFGNIPMASGLSSSASIEDVTAIALNDITKARLDTLSLVKMAKSCENNFVGMNCGIMDQFAICFGKKNKAVLLNCNSLDYSYIDFILPDDVTPLLINTNKPHNLIESKYNERCEECAEILKSINEVRKDKLIYLCELNSEEMDRYKTILHSEKLRRRFNHVVTENMRVFETVEALKAGKIDRVGRLMFASHHSLRYDYEVSGIELDTIVDIAKNTEGVIGARMTGGGFGGCVISLVKKNKVENFIKTVSDKYPNITGFSPSFYLVCSEDGAKKI